MQDMKLKVELTQDQIKYLQEVIENERIRLKEDLRNRKKGQFTSFIDSINNQLKAGEVFNVARS